MKKSIIIICAGLTIFSISAFNLINWSDSVLNPREKCVKTVVSENDLETTLPKMAAIDLVYNVDSRFMATIAKEDLHKAKSVLDIVPKEATGWWDVSFQSVTVDVLHDGDEIGATGYEKDLNASQMKLLQSTDYSNNIYIKARGKDIHRETGIIEDFVYYLTIIPENEAEFAQGHDALIDYLKGNSKEETAFITKDKLQPGRVNFTVTKEGTINNVKLDSTSGYPSVDKTLIKIISDMTGKWYPATNSKGENVDQELVFFFGLQGC